MIIEYIRYAIPSGSSTAFEQAYESAGDCLLESPHCMEYELTRCTEDETTYVLRIRWDSIEGHLRSFRQSDQFRRFYAHVKDFVPQIQEMRHYRTVLAGPASG